MPINLDTTLLVFILGLIVKSSFSLNRLENKVIEQAVKLEYLEKHLIKLDRELNFEITHKIKNHDNNN